MTRPAHLDQDDDVDAIRARLTSLIVEGERRVACRFNRYFPDCTDKCNKTSRKHEDHAGLCRELYRPHVTFMQSGAKHKERLFMAANQCGKTETAAYEVTAHLTGLYPDWWHGRRWSEPTKWWLAGDTMLSTRNILQVAMMGAVEGVETDKWTGMLPGHLVLDRTRKSGGVALCLDKVWVRHVSGGVSTFEFLSYDQGRKVFQGTGRDGIWLDEEPPDPPLASENTGETNDIYTECAMRTITTTGIIIATFTPLRGLTPFVQRYLENAVMPDDTGALRPAKEVFWPDESAA